MACPMCPAAGWAGGWIGGYFGIFPPQHPAGRLFSAAMTANLISITVIALKVIFDISFCDGWGTFTLTNIVRVMAKTLLLGIVYSIFVNYLLNRYVFPAPKEIEAKEIIEEKPPCCCHEEASV